MLKSMLLGLCIGLLLGTGCATLGGYSNTDTYSVDPDAMNRAQQTVDHWLAPEPVQPAAVQCRTYNWKNIYGQIESRTQCQ